MKLAILFVFISSLCLKIIVFASRECFFYIFYKEGERPLQTYRQNPFAIRGNLFVVEFSSATFAT